MSVLWPGCGSVSGAFQLCRSHMGGTYGSERETEKREDERLGGVGGRKKRKGEKLCEKQGFTQHYITFISPPCLPSLLLSNISD